MKGGVFIKTLYKILTFALAVVGVVYVTTTTAYAVDSEETVYLEKEFEIGDTAVYYCKVVEESGEFSVIDFRYTVDASTQNMCLYLETGDTPSGFTFNSMQIPSSIEYRYNAQGEFLYTLDGMGVSSYPPYEYNKGALRSRNPVVSTEGFRTNIPIFETRELAQAYVNGDIGVEQAINYNKTFDNGSWVSPFEDIEINDSSMLTPQLSNVSHNGFTLTNRNNEQLAVDIYVESGFQNPNKYLQGSNSLDDPVYAHSLGWLTNVDAAYMRNEFNLLTDFKVDNESLLKDSVSQFYTAYPHYNSWRDTPANKDNTTHVNDAYDIWGRPFGRQKAFWFFTSSVDASQIENVSIYSVPLCYTTYKVRYYYFDEASGMHYGPWSVYTYFSDGRMLSSGVFQGNDGSVIETAPQVGVQDSSGNIGYTDNTNYVDLNNPNELFSYIRSVFNNISATTGNFATI